jgi:hypothetical protein
MFNGTELIVGALEHLKFFAVSKKKTKLSASASVLRIYPGKGNAIPRQSRGRQGYPIRRRVWETKPDLIGGAFNDLFNRRSAAAKFWLALTRP